MPRRGRAHRRQAHQKKLRRGRALAVRTVGLDATEEVRERWAQRWATTPRCCSCHLCRRRLYQKLPPPPEIELDTINDAFGGE
jgi:hypothetical protein